jgi:hypothetical protein
MPMDATNDVPSTSAPAEFSFVRGGPFYRAEQAFRLINPDRWNLSRRIVVLIAISWLPLFIITALLNAGGLQSLLMDYRVHARLLIAVPVLLIGEIVMESRFRQVFSYLRESGLLDVHDMAYMDGVVANLVRLRDAYLPEIIIVALIFVRLALRYRALVDTTPWMGQELGSGYHFTVAGWYGALVSAPLFTFLLALAFWRWMLWTFFAFKLSRRNLKVVATHPDERGGLSFLAISISAFAPIVFAVCTVVGATWRHDVLGHGAHILNFKLSAIVLVVLILLIALGPLLFFVPRLAALRRSGVLEYGILGQLQSTEFQKKWILHRAGHEAEFFLAPEINILTGFGNKYEKIGRLLPFPADKGSLYGLAASIAIPALTVVLTEIPIAVVLQDLFKALR